MQTIDQLLREAESAVSKYKYYRKSEILGRGKDHLR